MAPLVTRERGGRLQYADQMRRRAPFEPPPLRDPVRAVAWGALLLALLLSFRHAPFPQQMALQHLPTMLALVLLATASHRLPLGRASFLLLVAFTFLHVLGARYIYSYVPYDEWIAKLSGLRLGEAFGFRRNQYDRLVHFAFGLLWVPPVREVLARRFAIRGRLGRYFAVELVLAASALYELFEWGLTMVLSPADAGAYNGEQGDRWDAQKDMACALLGAILTALASRREHARGERSLDPQT
jgi:putative membrane protein